MGYCDWSDDTSFAYVKGEARDVWFCVAQGNGRSNKVPVMLNRSRHLTATT